MHSSIAEGIPETVKAVNLCVSLAFANTSRDEELGKGCTDSRGLVEGAKRSVKLNSSTALLGEGKTVLKGDDFGGLRGGDLMVRTVCICVLGDMSLVLVGTGPVEEQVN